MFICLTVHGHLNCFLFLASMYHAAMNMHTHFLYTFLCTAVSFLLGGYLEVEFLGQR